MPKEATLTHRWKDMDLRSDLDWADHPAGLVELSDEEFDDHTGGSTSWGCATLAASVALSIAWCSPDGTLCGSCAMGTSGCC